MLLAVIGVLGFCLGMTSSEQEFLFGIFGSQKGRTEIVRTYPQSEEKNGKVGSSWQGAWRKKQGRLSCEEGKSVGEERRGCKG